MSEPQGSSCDQPPVPAVKGDGTRQYVRNELYRSDTRYDRGEQSVRCEDQISKRIAGDVSLVEKGVLGPSLEISCKSRVPVEGDDVVQKRPLADNGHDKPELRSCLQRGVRNGIQIQTVGQCCGAHVRFSLPGAFHQDSMANQIGPR